MIKLSFVFRDDWPVSTMMNSMDVWQIICYMKAFFILAEYCLVLWLSKGAPLENVALTKKPKISPKRTEIVMIIHTFLI